MRCTKFATASETGFIVEKKRAFRILRTLENIEWEFAWKSINTNLPSVSVQLAQEQHDHPPCLLLARWAKEKLHGDVKFTRKNSVLVKWSYLRLRKFTCGPTEANGSHYYWLFGTVCGAEAALPQISFKMRITHSLRWRHTLHNDNWYFYYWCD